MDKYKELYDFSRDAVAQSEARFDAVDNKVSTYLSVFTVLLGGAGFLVKWVADHLVPPRGLMPWLLVILAVTTAALAIGTWLSLLRVLKVQKIRVLAFDETIVQYFRANRLVDVHFNVARSLSQACIANQAAHEAKIEKLTVAYRMMMLTMTAVLLFSLLYGVHMWAG